MNRPTTKEEALNLIRTNGWFTYKELMHGLNMTQHQVKYLFCDIFKIKLKEEFKKWLEEKFKNGENPVLINCDFPNIPTRTMYRYYSKWRKNPENKTGLTKRQLMTRLAKCGYSLNCYAKRYHVSPDKVRYALKAFDLLDWFNKKQEEHGLKKHLAFKKYKKGELKNKLFEYFDKYPKALEFPSSKLAILFDANDRNIRAIKNKYKKQKELT